MQALYGASVLVAFIAGMAALIAPCCITVLFPSYFASVFKERYKVFLMTFIFFLGILTVFLPIGLGASALAQVFARYHNFVFTLGGLMLLLLGLTLLFGKSFEMPFSVNMPAANKYNIGSVYLLGVFSAVATTCCAPVLAGVLALSVASGTILWGTIYSLAYVLGMVIPLFIIAAFLDKINFTEKFKKLRSRREAKIGSFVWKYTAAELVSGIIFFGMGAYIIYLAFNNQLAMRSDYQLTLNLLLAKITYHTSHYAGLVPNWGWAAVIILLFVSLIILSIKQIRNKKDG